MLIKLVTAVLQLGLYCGPADTQQKNHEIALPYELTSLHNHPSHSPNHMPEAQGSDYYRKKIHAMQYAPLNHNARDILLPFHEQQALVNNDPNGISNLEIHKSKRKHLEPRKLPTNNHDWSINTPFILGHNVEVLKSVSRSPGHNNAYRNYPKGSEKRHDKVNFLRQYVISQIPSQPTERTYPSTETVEIKPALQTTKLAQQLYMDKQSNSNETYSFHNGDSITIENIQPRLRYAKSHRLHLNVARAFDLGSESAKTAADQEFINYIKLLSNIRN